MFKLFCPVGLLLTCLSANACDLSQTIASTTAAPPPKPVQIQRWFQQQKNAPTDPDILILGDSLADFWGATEKRDFPAKVVFNAGVAGDRTQNVLWRLQQPPFNSISPKAVVVLIGTNNLSEDSTSICGVIEGVKAVVIDVLSRFPSAKVFVVPVLPRGNDFKFRNADRQKINDLMLEEFAVLSRVATVAVDDVEISCGFGTSNAVKPACPNYRSDNLHLSGAGYAVLRKQIGLANTAKFSVDALK